MGTDEEIVDWVARDAETALHPSCTCRLGVDELSVVDPETMRVHGVDGLRVVDASVFPYVTNGNIYAPVMMVAEKAADLILGVTPLEPSQAPFYRYAAAERAGLGAPAYIDALGSVCQSPKSLPSTSVHVENQPMLGTGIASPASPPSSFTLAIPALMSSTSK